MSELENETPQSIDRRALIKLPMAEWQKVLAEQAEAMVQHYAQDPDWREWVSLDSTQKRRQSGSAKRQIWMAPDFDAPLEDFQEYVK